MSNRPSIITNTGTYRMVTDSEINKWDSNKYTHPSSHPAKMITQDSTHRFVTDSEKSTWNNKADKTTATTTVNGYMSSSDKSKLNGIATGATKETDTGNINVANMSNKKIIYRKFGHVVCVWVFVSGTLNLSGGEYITLTTLPAGYRPQGDIPLAIHFQGGQNGASGYVRSTGKVEIYSSALATHYAAFCTYICS